MPKKGRKEESRYAKYNNRAIWYDPKTGTTYLENPLIRFDSCVERDTFISLKNSLNALDPLGKFFLHRQVSIELTKPVPGVRSSRYRADFVISPWPLYDIADSLGSHQKAVLRARNYRPLLVIEAKGLMTTISALKMSLLFSEGILHKDELLFAVRGNNEKDYFSTIGNAAVCTINEIPAHIEQFVHKHG